MGVVQEAGEVEDVPWDLLRLGVMQFLSGSEFS